MVCLGMQEVEETKNTKRSHFQAVVLANYYLKRVILDSTGMKIEAHLARLFRFCNPLFTMSPIAGLQTAHRRRPRADRLKVAVTTSRGPMERCVASASAPDSYRRDRRRSRGGSPRSRRGFVAPVRRLNRVVVRNRSTRNMPTEQLLPRHSDPRAKGPTLSVGQRCPSRGRICVGLIAPTSDRPPAQRVRTNGQRSAEAPPALPAGGRRSR
jgi:hypothetical protein